MASPTLRSNHHVDFQCAYHAVWAPKYRRPVLAPPVDERLQTILAEPSSDHSAWLQALEVMPDHVHLHEVDPQFGIHRLVKGLKGRSSRVLRQEFPT